MKVLNPSIPWATSTLTLPRTRNRSGRIGWLCILANVLLIAAATPGVASLRSTQVSSEFAGGSAHYRVTFESTWSQQTHPHPNGADEFHSSRARYSRLIGATHDDGVALWQLGLEASDGIEQMAEAGQSAILRTEVEAATDLGVFPFSTMSMGSFTFKRLDPGPETATSNPTIMPIALPDLTITYLWPTVEAGTHFVDASELGHTVTVTETEVPPEGSAAAEVAHYQVIFESTWSEITHPNPAGFPAGAHYSPLIGATHNDQISFWTPNGEASAGVEEMAETGRTVLLSSEIQTAIDSGTAERLILGAGLPNTPGVLMTTPFSVSHSYPLLTLVTMVAPSPDWFVGIHGNSLLDDQGNWNPKLVIDLYPYDAGTDSGTQYTSANQDTDPQDPIADLTGVSPFSTASMGTFTVVRVTDAEPSPPPSEKKNLIYLSILLAEK